jgi:co-chaperonin GroES (HSP10)
MPLRPLNDSIILEPEPEEFVDVSPEVEKAIREGKILLPEKYESFFKKVAMRGTVISCGDKCRYNWKHGDKVIYGRFCGAPLPIKDKKYRVIREYEALAKEENA